MKNRRYSTLPETTPQLDSGNTEIKNVNYINTLISDILSDRVNLSQLYEESEFFYTERLAIDDPVIANVLKQADFPDDLELTIYDRDKAILRHYRTSGRKVFLIRQLDAFKTRLLLLINQEIRNRSLPEQYQLTDITRSLIDEVNRLVFKHIESLR